ncbi:uncharacterized protein LOC111778610 isoform X2 [Cucurbita pepo subsp. pepo]|uniref:uncharacterized protein LOC111778610 isoform X1 n=1 Tax=Cucurbita pepo subsp. pepo TaxID=3664 RepID=UPI000C9D7250|nr:uncharacterized protein LOC111778610 isoform X1 [Cucurbita pepo subsp. pepo]XP_023514304.1 uncharacterized protein LOC111778610 isoform X2 [Cucurbita pepo subsp. pepo]
MGSLENGFPLKRDPFLRSSSTNKGERYSYLQRPRSRFSRFLLFQKFDYLQWICTVVVFLFFVVLFQMFLPGSVVEKSEVSFKDAKRSLGDLKFLEELGMLEFGEDIRFEPSKLLEKFQRESRETGFQSLNRTRNRYGYRKPQLALVFSDLLVDSYQVLMVTIASALQEIGYVFQVYSLQGGPVSDIWRQMGVPVTLIQTCDETEVMVDWLNYDGILMHSLEVKDIYSCFLQEPFKSLPIIWTIREETLALRSQNYASSGLFDLLNDWKRVFNHSTVVVFPNYVMPMVYSTFDSGNFFVIPSYPPDTLEAEIDITSLRARMGYANDDLVIAIVGSQFLYRGMWMEHAMILQAILPLLHEFSLDEHSNSHLKIFVLSGDSNGNYTMAVEAIAQRLEYPRSIVEHVPVDSGSDNALSMADFIIYSSFLEEQSFPQVLVKAMGMGKPIIAPDLAIIRKYVDDRVNGYLFPKGNFYVLSQIIMQMVSKGRLSPLARSIASIGRGTVKNLMVSETVEGYASLLDAVLKLPSEAAPAKEVAEIPSQLKEKWQWKLFEGVSNLTILNRNERSFTIVDEFEKHWNHSKKPKPSSLIAFSESFVYDIWEEEKHTATSNIKRRREEEEIKDRTEQPHTTWEDVYRSAKRADRSKNDLHERDEGELERTGQPLCIYEPYFGEGVWPFLHRYSLYRGIGLSSKGRRPGVDDIDAPSRLPLLNNPYYRNVLGEYGAFFAIANRVDRIHKNAWIGFQSWRATARNVSLSKIAESALLDAIQTRRHGDALYFWARMDSDPRNPHQLDFWSFCDSINAGNCKFAFSESLKTMFGIKGDQEFLPPMPADGSTWSAMQSWALPTRSFLEFVMFSRMFVDALDAQFYDEHHLSGRCYLSLSKDKHCYSRLLELLVNVWAYHSARRIVYVNPETGAMQEQHKFDIRRGQMWIKWFSYDTLKNMDEDLGEEADADHPTRRWLWPSTGEVFWQGVYEREKNLRDRQKENRKKKSKAKLDRMRHRRHQKVIGKYVKPPPEMENSTTTISTEPILKTS